MTNNGSTTQACAACKYQRRKCTPECPLAPYFPADQPKQFLNVHRLFGVSNVLRLLRQVDPSKKSDAMKSIVYEADAWEKDPVHGCFGIISMLQEEVDRLRQELELVRNHIVISDQHQTAYFHQQQQPFQTIVSGTTSFPVAGPWAYSYMPSNINLEGTSGVVRAGYDARPGYDIKLLELEPRQLYQNSSEPYETRSTFVPPR
eukprot:c18602_g1_i1 orf=208-816(-)